MNKLLFISLVLIAGFATAFGADKDWNNGGGDRLWRNGANWSGGIPTTADKAAVRNNYSTNGPIIDSATSTSVATVVIGDWSSASDKVEMTGGTLSTTSWVILGYGAANNGTFTVSNGTANIGSNLDIGFSGTGTLNMTGGSITITSRFGIAQNTGSTGKVFLNGGTIRSGSFNMTSGGTLDISGGTLIVNGNITSVVAGYVAALKIKAYGGTGTVNYDYNITNSGKTTIWGTPGTAYVTVPDVTGLPQATAESNIRAAGLVVGTVTTAPSDAVPTGCVISQTPTGGESAAFGSSVNLVVRPEAGNGDVDGDGYVDATDLILFAAEWLQPTPDPDADFTRDGHVDMPDFQILSANWLLNEFSKTLTGKIMCGYQGWFNCPNDGSNRGWIHWGSSNKFEPGYCTVEWWPDMSQYDADEKFASGFKNADNSTAYVFSSFKEKTVLRHFSWMADYGIDGVFLQRFVSETTPGSTARAHRDQVMLHCRKGGNQYKRAWAMMYDLSSTYTGPQMKQKVIDDWKYLVDTYHITKDSTDTAYLHHKGKPVVAIWGLGFGRTYEGTQDMVDVVSFLKNDPVYGGCAVMIGVQNSWRTNPDTYFQQIVTLADIISPWAVGRYGSKSTSELDNFTNTYTIPDQAWCNTNNKDYLPVVFPGFSWQNLKQNNKFDEIPRLGGTFLWRQYYKAIHDAGATMIYQAMFDEVDEGTAIFKCTSTPPIAELPTSVFSNPFLPTGNAQYAPYQPSDALLPSDHYLWLVGEGTKMLRGEIPLSPTMPTR